jgi:hypothetical protein
LKSSINQLMINLFKIKDFIKKNLSVVLIIVCFFLLLDRCNQKYDYEKSSELIDLKIKINEDKIKEIENQNSLLQKENESLVNKIDSLGKKNRLLSDKINSNTISKKKEQSKVADYTEKDIDKYYSTRYVFQNQKDLDKQIIKDLIGYDYSLKELDFTKEQVSLLTEKNNFYEKYVENQKQEIVNLNEVISMERLIKNDLKDHAKEQYKELEKSFKNNKTLKIMIPVALIGGLILGTQIN